MPVLYEAKFNRGFMLINLQRLEEALKDYETCLENGFNPADRKSVV